MANIQKQKKRGRDFKRHSLPCRCRKMLRSHIEVCFQGSVLAFKDIPSFATWVHLVEGSFKVIGIRGVGARHGHSDPLLSHFVTLDLHLEGPPGCWRRQRIGYLRKRCGHCPIEREAVMRTRGEEREAEEISRPMAEGFRSVALGCSDVGQQEAPATAVTSAAEGFEYDPQAEGDRLCLSQRSSQDLPLLPIQQQPLAPALSADDGSASSLFSLEREAVRTRRHPWRSRGGDLDNLKQYYPVWITWQRMSKERKSLVVRKLEF